MGIPFLSWAILWWITLAPRILYSALLPVVHADRSFFKSPSRSLTPTLCRFYSILQLGLFDSTSYLGVKTDRPTDKQWTDLIFDSEMVAKERSEQIVRNRVAACGVSMVRHSNNAHWLHRLYRLLASKKKLSIHEWWTESCTEKGEVRSLTKRGAEGNSR